MRANQHYLPGLAIETEWSESFSGLQDDMNQLLVGGNEYVHDVVVLNWTQLANKRGQYGIPKLLQQEVCLRLQPVVLILNYICRQVASVLGYIFQLRYEIDIRMLDLKLPWYGHAAYDMR